jgi:hypothetical protein
MQRDFAPDQWKKDLDPAVEKLDEEGFTVRAQVAPRAIGVFLGLQCTFHPFMGYPAYKEIAHLPLDERVALMKTADFKPRSWRKDPTSWPVRAAPSRRSRTC